MAEIKKESFGKLSDGREVFLFTLRNTKGTEVKVTSYGARLVSYIVRDKDFKKRDIVLGYDSAEAYEKDTTSMGGVVGRHANRIAGGKAVIGGKEYQLELNTGSKKQNHIHGGFKGFHLNLWDYEVLFEGVKFTYHAKDGEGGYPGNMTVTALYSLSNDNELSIKYEAECDADTICNLTNHAYFNLDGYEAGAEAAMKQKMQIFADSYTWADAESLPDGRILPVEGTPMDLREPTPIGLHIDDDFDELQMGHGYDHNWVLRDVPVEIELKPGMFGYDPTCPIDYNAGGLKKAAYVESEESGLTMTCFTTLPGMQFYSGNHLKGDLAGKNGVTFPCRSGFCLETQYFPNALANPSFPQPILKKGEKYQAQTIYTVALKD
ncbi:aldose epimerase family protein [Selenomonas sp. KH1T6]|uniref:aldose epimerase family protein n=1 Tax=Selenomonas sp. KH1T6 TaxID=3158784 RepID=UPI0008A76E0E|nr:aldose 1-epimerase [Selenomonas ruminantium]